MWDHEIGALKAPINCTAIFQPLVNFGPAIVYTLRIGIFVHLCRVCISMYSVSTSLQAVYRCWFGWWRCSWVRGSWDDENFGWIPHLESIAFLMCALRVHINKSIFGKVLLGIEKIVDKTFSKISLLMCAHRAHISKILFIISLNVIKILCYCSFF